jgi:hypothetical protein
LDLFYRSLLFGGRNPLLTRSCADDSLPSKLNFPGELPSSGSVDSVGALSYTSAIACPTNRISYTTGATAYFVGTSSYHFSSTQWEFRESGMFPTTKWAMVEKMEPVSEVPLNSPSREGTIGHFLVTHPLPGKRGSGPPDC